ncbi:MAG: bifunctional (p)ppGpp synthetase/guanosine-3',5'-bis(diphosphate) 3'-pyrophosphohydrolase [Kiloniellales bacterium]|nr:bifunctional (p)ppGpp synthetase/guanosine-3',5'-bis(diphosphate) 3'-pyrophosphohydrolase [Kiloniellales bacterium]
MIRQFELVEKVKSYDPGADEGLLNRAYVFAMKAHGSQTRASGDPYFSHPLEVAGILTDLKLDSASIATALLHDIVEDTEASLSDVEMLFGPDIARLVDGVTKLTRLELQSEQTKHAENFRKLLLAMSEDIRVLLVKLADRLHNMQTLHFVKNPDKRRRIARETMDIYAPLAERIGMQRFKDELQDLAFAVLNSDARDSILARLNFLREQGGDLLERVREQLARDLEEGGVKAKVSGRLKSPYSIWRKMEQRNLSFEQLADTVAFRVVVPTVGDCYHALGILHSRYPTVPGRFKDYISTPKPNGYRSLHTGLIGPEQQRIEIQIRTREMHEIAEFGVAAHWKYKQGAPMVDGRQYRWVRELLDILDHASNPEEFLEHTKLEMFQDQVFCFTPKGDLIALPSGATPLDFAYAVHSEVGDTCVGAKVNGRMVPLRTRLANGDQVQIVTSKAQTPSPDWEKFAVTGKARARIRRFVRAREREQYVELGRNMLEKAFRQEGQDLTEKALKGGLKKLKADSIQDLHFSVGTGHTSATEVVRAVYPESKERSGWRKVVSIGRAKGKRDKAKDSAIPIKGLIPGMALHYAHCCHPLPGDRIVGIVTTGKGVTVHTIDCDTLQTFAETPERWVDLAWDVDGSSVPFLGRLNVVVANEPGSLGNLSTVIGKNDGNISNLKITNRSIDFFEMLIDVEVKDLKHLTDIMAALRAMSVITSVERARS